MQNGRACKSEKGKPDHTQLWDPSAKIDGSDELRKSPFVFVLSYPVICGMHGMKRHAKS